MSNDGCSWGRSSVWEDAIWDAENGDLAPLVELLRTTAPRLAQLLERGRFRPGPCPREVDEALYRAASLVRALRAIQNKGPTAAPKFQKLARLNGGTLSALEKFKILRSLGRRERWSVDDNTMLMADPGIQRELYKMSKATLVEQVAKQEGVSEGALNNFLAGKGRYYRRFHGRR